MNEGYPEYGKSRFPKKQPKGICRGCRNPITEKYRQTWCSDECHNKFDPFYVKAAVRKRCGDKCEKCGKDCSRLAIRNYSELATHPPTYHDCGLQYPYDGQAHHNHPLYKQYLSEYREWKRNKPSPEYDHIIPHSEGGLFTPDNIRLLCRKCHLARTKEWHVERRKKLTAQPALL